MSLFHAARVGSPHTTMTLTRRAPRLLLLVALTISAIGFPSETRAQTAGPDVPDRITGAVLDSSGARVPGATVVVRGESTAFERFADASADGRFALSGLTPGSYQIEAFAPGFASTAVQVTLPSSEALEIRLSPAPVIEQVRVVSGSRQEELRESLNTRVDVITRSRIEDTAAETVAEVLRELPGVVTRRGSETSTGSGEQIQGIEARQVLVLLDGQPIVGARGIKRGAINLDRQSTGRLERVEVVKGASSALYGSDAIGGVINLITREPSSRFDLGGTLSGGNYGDVNARVESGVKQGAWTGLFSVERHQHDGFDLTPTTFDTTGAPFRRTDALGKARVQIAPDLAVSGLATGYHNRTKGRSVGELGSQEDDIRDRAINTGVSADWLAGPSTTIQGRGYFALYEEDSTGFLAPPASTPLAPGALDQQLGKADISLSQLIGARQQIQAGAEWWHDSYDGINRLRDDEAQSATTSVAWAQHRLNLINRVTTTVGLRVDHHSAFGTAVSPKVAANVRLVDGLHARASFGRGFRAPDLGQLYYRFLNPSNLYQVVGNPNLEPEYSNSVQIGSEYVMPNRRARIGLNFFHNEVEDLIESVSLGVLATPAQLQALIAAGEVDPSFNPVFGRLLFVYRNLNNVVTQGAEVDGETALTSQLSVGGAYTYLDAKDRDRDLYLTGRHRHQGHVRFAWQEERLGLRANLRATYFSSWIAARTTLSTGGVQDTAAPAFTLWDAYVSQRVVRGLNAFLAVDNLTDNQDPNTGVILASGSPAPIYRPEVGRTVRVGVRWSWATN